MVEKEMQGGQKRKICESELRSLSLFYKRTRMEVGCIIFRISLLAVRCIYGLYLDV